MCDRFIFNAIVSGMYYIDTPEEYKEFEPTIYLKNVDVFNDGYIGIHRDKLEEAIKLQHPEIAAPEFSQLMNFFEDNSNSIDNEAYLTINAKKILQCTGLKDKNGKLIYEGDIVKFAEYDWTDISFKDWEQQKAVVIWGGDYDYPAFDLKGTDFDGTNGLAYIFGEGWTIEIIGNIYENPELLEG